MSLDHFHQLRNLIRNTYKASIAVSLYDSEKECEFPYVSLVLCAFDYECNPLLFISDLAEHTKALRYKNQFSLLIDATGQKENILTESRLTLQGEAEFISTTSLPDDLDRYFLRHPSARAYQAFRDFHCVKLHPNKAHLVAGFGKISWYSWEEITSSLHSSCFVYESERDIINHMNIDHSDVVALISSKILKSPETGWTICGIDPDGCDLKLGNKYRRYPFQNIIRNNDDIRKEFVKAAKIARQIP